MASGQIDPVIAQAIKTAIDDDEAFQRIIKRVAAKGLSTLEYWLQHGTPQEQIRIAMQLSKIYQTALENKVVDGEDAETSEDRARTMLLRVMGDSGGD